ncbi:MAG: hypothetical protein HY907_06940 [Deltaproteobacteria bacterium]|nr:hypothetical protein [Deltaproteobacteria bacterium]
MGPNTAALLVAVACLGCARAEDLPGDQWAEGTPDRAEDAGGESTTEGEDDGADASPPDAPEAPDVPEAEDEGDAAPPDEGADPVDAADGVDDVEDGEGEAETCGSSSCLPGQTCCSATCVDTSVDTANCGGCGVRCDPDKSDRCAGGSCRCESESACGGGSWIACCPPDGCVDLDWNNAHCGSCDWDCWYGETCSFGTCSSSGP